MANAREVKRGFGMALQTPVFIGSDNSANVSIASGRSNPTRMRHAARRYTAFLERLAQGEVEVGHVPDEENPSDFLTKWVKKDKIGASLQYLCNTRNAVK